MLVLNFCTYMAMIIAFILIPNCLFNGICDWYDMAEEWYYERKAQKALQL